MRDVEEISTEETALLLGLRPAAVKTRLHRARMLLHGTLQDGRLATYSLIRLSMWDRSGVAMVLAQHTIGSRGTGLVPSSRARRRAGIPKAYFFMQMTVILKSGLSGLAPHCARFPDTTSGL
jgi:hypothetical protein